MRVANKALEATHESAPQCHIELQMSIRKRTKETAMSSATIPVGELLYEVTAHFTKVTEYGVSLEAVRSGQVAPPPAGARFDLAFEGAARGPKLKGTVMCGQTDAGSCTSMGKSPPMMGRKSRSLPMVLRPLNRAQACCSSGKMSPSRRHRLAMRGSISSKCGGRGLLIRRRERSTPKDTLRKHPNPRDRRARTSTSGRARR